MDLLSQKIIETKLCPQCQSDFPITDKDRDFYTTLSPTFTRTKFLIPTPILCPSCRAQNTLATRNERNLYKRKCDATGKDIVSIHSPDKTFPVYDQNYWW
jgi:Zn ribbon nucleic-acid-binding protein